MNSKFNQLCERIGLVAPGQIPNRALDSLCTSISGMRDGVGPLLTLYLVRDAHLSPELLATVLAAPAFTGLACQVPIGIAFDRLNDKRWLVAAGAILLALCSLIMSQTHVFQELLFLQIGCGLAMCLLNVGVPALSVADTSPETLGPRLARNEVFCKIGNFSSIIIAGFLAEWFSLKWIFYVVAIYATPVVLSSFFIKTKPPEVVRQPNDSRRHVGASGGLLATGLAAFKQYRFVSLLVLVFIYMFAGTPHLMIFEQAFAKTPGAAGYISTAMIVMQATIFLSTLVIAKSKNFGNTMHFLFIGFVAMTIRSVLLGVGTTSAYAVPTLFISQILDAVTAAIILLVPTRALAEIDRSNFNLLAGILGTCASLGAALSMMAGGYLIKHGGTNYAFGVFSIISAVGTAAAWLAAHPQYFSGRFAVWSKTVKSSLSDGIAVTCPLIRQTARPSISAIQARS